MRHLTPIIWGGVLEGVAEALGEGRGVMYPAVENRLRSVVSGVTHSEMSAGYFLSSILILKSLNWSVMV